MKLFRPVGIKELQLILDSNCTRFPPRLSWQPIFYPVLNQAYAEQIAREWNTQDENSDYCGIVTSFNIDDAYYQQYAPQTVGDDIHQELWVPAEELANFNDHILNGIHIVNAFFGENFIRPTTPILHHTLSKFY
ncbi:MULTISPECIES: ADP-ribosylation/crystallin J1 [unclassified Chitinophaga]|uniref:ADP-ribosylation/crystallin J1 n=1 Tax=unclassified Chitinophaga TaxID=2619133 RepID=UPI0009D60192|nr:MULTISPECIES: ADP-ribosylation/crystallin J1 [unclassified Chitinophaga]OMP76321.1 ADP-ribosylation/crystallin J1 [[Flexibacter] sp. ATCC 35208]WPV67894.1 ADP-ribosylation/crystallin J1 [Chitinophaga sp. LS1]